VETLKENKMKYQPWMRPFIVLKVSLEPKMIWLRIKTLGYRLLTIYWLVRAKYAKAKLEVLQNALKQQSK